MDYLQKAFLLFTFDFLLSLVDNDPYEEVISTFAAA